MTHSDKKKIINNLIEVPETNKRMFWAKEIKFLNILIESYPSEKFWKGVCFSKKFETLNLLRSGYFSEELKKKFKRFNYKIPKKPVLDLQEKCGEDYNKPKKIITKRDFLS